MVRMVKPGKHKQVQAFIKTELPKVMKDAKVFGAYIKWSSKGGMHPLWAMMALYYGWGPEIRVEALVGNYAEYRATKAPHVIFLAKTLADKFEKDHKRAVAKQFLQCTILHEMMHWADWVIDKKHLTKKVGGKTVRLEEGMAFEKDAYGKVLYAWY